LAHEGQDTLFEQDFDAQPPELDGLVESWVDWVGYGEYERSGGQPFAAPLPPDLPAEVSDIYIDVEGGAQHRGDGCIYRWKDVFVWIRYTDGSSFVWWHIHTELDCPGESLEVFDNVIATGGIEDPANGAWSGWVRSYSREDLQVQRRASLRATPGTTVELGSLVVLSSNPVGGEGVYTSFDVTFAPGAILDLRGVDLAQGPLFETGGPVVVRCDTVLMDPGIVLSSVFGPGASQAPSQFVDEPVLLSAPAAMVQPGPNVLRLRAMNLGNQPQLGQLDWIDVLGWSWGGVFIDGDLSDWGLLQVPVDVPPGTPPGTEDQLQVQVTAGASTDLNLITLMRAQDMAPGAQIYCSAKTNSLGCMPQISSTGNASLTGYDDFVIHATDVLPHKSGILFYGPNPNQFPFQDGFLCVQGPLTRTPVRQAKALSSGATCDGWYSFEVTHDFMQAAGFVPGQTLYFQWWMRDPGDAYGTGLSDGIQFEVGP